MSHFCGLVINTPDYNGSVDSALEPYYEGLEYDEYKVGELSNFEKIRVVGYYSKKYTWGVLSTAFAKHIDFTDEKKEASPYRYKDEFVEFVKKHFPNALPSFSRLYKKHGKDWNSNEYRKDNGKWCCFSTYNPKSKWDWFVEGGRWDSSIKTKTGEYVNNALLGEIDWTPFADGDYDVVEKTDEWTGKTYRPLREGVKWHFTEDNVPFCIVINGEWYEKGEMGWFGLTTNEKGKQNWEDEVKSLISNLPEDSEVTLIDFHI